MRDGYSRGSPTHRASASVGDSVCNIVYDSASDSVAYIHGHRIEQPASDTSSVLSYLDIPLALKKRLNNFNDLARAEASSGVELTSLDIHRLCFTRRVACVCICVRVWRLAAAWLAV